MVQFLGAEDAFPLLEAGSATPGGWLLAEQGQVEAGITQMREGLAA